MAEIILPVIFSLAIIAGLCFRCLANIILKENNNQYKEQ